MNSEASLERQGPDVVATSDEALGLERPPLLVLDRLAQFLDEHGLGAGPLAVERIGEGGGSNVSYLVEREGAKLVVRRPPRPPLPPSAHDMVREARLQLALTGSNVRLPRIRAVCEDVEVLGVPFYVMDFIDGDVVTDVLPPAVEDAASRRALGLDFVDALAEIHSVDVATPALAPFIRSGSYLERQVRRFSELWEINRTRDVPAVTAATRALAAAVPAVSMPAVVHGDYRMGNVIVSKDAPQVVAVLDWEMGAVGDARADLGYLLAMYSEPGGTPTPLGTSPVTATPGFPSKSELVDRYAATTGADIPELGWFVALALWKAAVFGEGIYDRYRRGVLSSEDEFAARFESAVPALAEAALAELRA